MSTIWDWSPVFDAANDFLDSKKGTPSLLDRLIGQGHMTQTINPRPQASVRETYEPAMSPMTIDLPDLSAALGGPASAPRSITVQPPAQVQASHPLAPDVGPITIDRPVMPGTYPSGATYDGPLGRALGSAAGPVGSFLQNFGRGLPSAMAQAGGQGAPALQSMDFQRPVGAGAMPRQMVPVQPMQRPVPIITRLIQGNRDPNGYA